MKTILTLFCCIAAMTVSAQRKPKPGIIPWKPGVEKKDPPTPMRDSILKKLSNTIAIAGTAKSFPDTIIIGEHPPVNGMPNAINTQPPPPLYKGNNGKGFELYESLIDRMAVLMPDSANRASLKMSRYQMPNRAYVVPKNKKNPGQ